VSDQEYVVALAAAGALAADRVGPKAATQARLLQAGLPVPDGFCLTADAYRAQLRAAGVEASADAAGSADDHAQRRLALDVKLGLQRTPLVPALAAVLGTAWRALVARPPGLVAVRSSALLEDTSTASFAGQFDSYLGIATEDDLVTTVRACWAALWAGRALRYMETHGVDPGQTAMAVLVQRLIQARAAGGALSRGAEDAVVISGTWGLGSAVAQGEVVPDRFVVRRDGTLAEVAPGRKDRVVRASAEVGARPEAVPADLVDAPCLDEAEAIALARIVIAAEEVVGGAIEVEWALGDDGLQLLQARPLRLGAAVAVDEAWRRRPVLRGQPVGVGWGTGPARIVLSEHDLEHVETGDVLVTQVAGPALTAVLQRVAGVVAELGGSTSHLASLARERGIPAVLGVAGATRRIPSGATVAVDGVAGLVRWVA
jgi:pyruvate,water dikinase